MMVAILIGAGVAVLVLIGGVFWVMNIDVPGPDE